MGDSNPNLLRDGQLCSHYTTPSNCTLYENRTRICWLKTSRPKPLDEQSINGNHIITRLVIFLNLIISIWTLSITQNIRPIANVYVSYV